MIKSILIFNTRGQARALRFFDSCPIESQQKLLREAFQIVSKRDVDACNFVEFNEFKLIYRHYATLYFVMMIDSTESEYDIYEMIHMLVQCLDQQFENVCELDLIFHSDKVNQILNEIFVGGFIVERSFENVLADFQTQTQIAKEEAGVLSHMGSKMKSAVNTKREKIKMDINKKLDGKK